VRFGLGSCGTTSGRAVVWALSSTGRIPALFALVKYVAVSGCVCWYCHQSGGTDVVNLPDILLPDGQYMDI